MHEEEILLYLLLKVQELIYLLIPTEGYRNLDFTLDVRFTNEATLSQSCMFSTNYHHWKHDNLHDIRLYTYQDIFYFNISDCIRNNLVESYLLPPCLDRYTYSILLQNNCTKFYPVFFSSVRTRMDLHHDGCKSIRVHLNSVIYSLYIANPKFKYTKFYNFFIFQKLYFSGHT